MSGAKQREDFTVYYLRGTGIEIVSTRSRMREYVHVVSEKARRRGFTAPRACRIGR